VFNLTRFHLKFIDDSQRVVGIVAAILYVLIELSFTTLVDENTKTGKITLNWRLKSGVGYSSFAQFWSNVCFAPFLLLGYRYVMASIDLDDSYARIFFFPLSIWLLEAISGYVIMFLFGTYSTGRATAKARRSEGSLSDEATKYSSLSDPFFRRSFFDNHKERSDDVTNSRRSWGSDATKYSPLRPSWVSEATITLIALLLIA